MATAEYTLEPGNWQEFDCFAWFDKPADAHEFAIVYTSHRDSDLLTESNAAVIAKALEPYQECGDVIPQRHNHWLVGWVDGFAIRVNRDGQQTDAARVYLELCARMADYPILDESDYSERECEAQEQAWKDWAQSDFVRALERRFDCEIDTDLGDIGELFRELADSACIYWETDNSGVSIAVDLVAEQASADDVRPFVQPQALRVWRDGQWLFDVAYHLGELSADCPLYAPELEAIAEAMDNELESADGLTWEII